MAEGREGRGRSWTAWIAAGAALGVASVLQAQEPAPAPQPAPGPVTPARETVVVVTASPLRPADVFDTPYSADVLEGEELLTRRLARTIPDAFKEIPGASAQKTAQGHGSPFLRGFTGFRNVFLIDGIRLNNSVFREGPNQYWNTVDEFLIDRLEIVRGPASVLYGSDSIGGTVAAYTVEPPRVGDGFHIHERTFARYASAEDSYTLRQEVKGGLDALGFRLGVTYRDFDDLTGGRRIGLMPNTGYNEYDADLKLVYRLDDRSKLLFAVQHTRQDEVPRTHRTNRSVSWHGTTVGTDARADFDQGRDLVYVQYHGTFEGGVLDSLKASVSWQHVDERFQRDTSSTAATASRREIREMTVHTPACWVQVGKDTAVGHLTGGVDYYRDFVQSSGHDWLVNGTYRGFARGEVADDAEYDLFGVYLQDEFAVGALSVTPGIRFTRATVDARNVDPNPSDAVVFEPLDDTYQAVTGSLRFLYHVTENWNAIAGWGMGFRTPSLDDTTAIKLVMSGALDLPSRDLDPETAHTFDGGVRARYADWEFSAFGFYTLLRDFVRRVPAGDFNGDGVVDNTKENFADGWVFGGEFGALVRVTEEASVRGDFGFARGRADAMVAGAASEEPLDKVAPPVGHLAVRFQPKGSGVWIEGIVTAAGRQHHLSPSDEADTQRIPPGGTPGYVVYGLRGGYRVSEHVTATLAIDNITDVDYRVHGSGQNEPGTNVVIGLDATF